MKIKGNTVGTPMPRSDLNQTNPRKADYVKGRELVTAHIAAKGNVHGLTAEQVGAEPAGTAQTFVNSHNTNTAAHNDIRILIADLVNRLNAIANSDDNTLDQMAEIVDYIKDNRDLIETITTSKVNVADIIDNLYTNVPDKPLSAAQGVALKSLIDTLAMFVEQETSGCPIVIDGAAEAPLNGLILYGKTTQDGTPTPSAPVELASAGADGDIAVKVYRGNTLPFPYAESSANQAGVKVVVEDDGGITWEGTPNGYVGLYLYKGSPIWSGLTTFAYYGDCKNLIFEIVISHASGKQTLLGNNLAINFDNYSNITNVDVLLKRDVNNVPTDGTVYPIVVQGNIEGDMQSATFPTPNGLPGIPVSSGGNYTDANGQQWICDEMDFERGVYVKRVVLCETNHSDYMDSTGKLFCMRSVADIATDAKVTKRLLSPQYEVLDLGAAREANYAITHVGSTVYVRNADYPDLVSFNAACKVTPVTYLAILQTPVETPLPAETIAAYKTLHTYSPSTTILNDGGAWMHVKYSGYNNSFINSVAELVSEHNVSPTAHDDIRQKMLSKSGGTMTGAIAMGGNKITGLGTPTADTDAATKAYADKMLPKTGGTLTGHMYVAPHQHIELKQADGTTGLMLYGSGEGGNIVVYSPSGKAIKSWEMDSVNGNFRIYGTKSDNSNIFPFVINSDGTIQFIDSSYVNPKMNAGTEYKLAEYWNGKPVYAKLVSRTFTSQQGNASGFTQVNIAHNIGSTPTIVRAEANINGQYMLPYIDSTGGSVTVANVNATNIVLHFYKTYWDNPTVNVTLYYTKG